MENITINQLKKYSILSWIKLNKDSNVLCINIDEDIVKLLKIVNPTVNFSIDINNKTYDYIFAFHILEEEPKLLNTLFNNLNEDGTLYLLTENINSMSYVCGKAHEYLNTYSKEYITNELLKNNYYINNCFSVFPSYEEAQLVISENYMINESIENRYVPTNKDNFERIVNERKMLGTITDKKQFHNNANNYLFSLSKKQKEDNILQVTLSSDRGLDNFSITTIYTDKVEKQYPFNPNTNLLEYSKYLKEHNIKLVDMVYEHNIYSMPYIKYENCLLYFKRLLQSDIDKFITACDKYYQTIIHSSKCLKVNEYGMILERCYFDLVPLNCFVINDEFIFFDQEFYIENYPIDMVMWRSLYLIYNNTDNSEDINMMFDRYNIKHVPELIKMSDDFIRKLRNLDE